MKKQLLGLMTILTLCYACQKDEATSLTKDATIHANLEENDVTRTIMDENNNILWSENDQIIAFMKSSYGLKYQVKPSFVGKSHADFSIVSSGNGSDLSAGNEWEHNVVYYPYSEDIECLKSGANYELEVNLPAEQVYVPDSFANGSMTMVAVSESNNITFKNVLGGIKLQLKGTQKVTSIKIEGKNNEKLSGAAIVTAYTDETKPAVTMSSNATASVTLNCGEGVQLNESKATEFIISLPPVLFSNGFTVTITDTDAQIYIVGTDKANTILRSSILVMPAFNLKDGPQFGDNNYVEEIYIDKASIVMAPGTSYTFITDVIPADTTDKTLTWSSSNDTVVQVDQNGKITALSAGNATIKVIAQGGASASSAISVINTGVADIDYIDEYGVNHGKGIGICGVVWAPVNCGYKAPEGDKKGYPCGKLYQWGRKYGQGHSLEYDEMEPEIVEGPVMPSIGQSESYSNTYILCDGDWSSMENSHPWNEGTETNPIKSSNDPCPAGWRIPTKAEIMTLVEGDSQSASISSLEWGRYFFGNYTNISEAPKLFLPAAGRRSNYDGVSSMWDYGYYWSSSEKLYLSHHLHFFWNGLYTSGSTRDYAEAWSIRCVQE